MIVGVPKEIKNNENRVGIVPAGVYALTKAGHRVMVEKNAGVGSGISDEEFSTAGAEITKSAEEIYQTSDMVIKVKEPQPVEYDYFRKGLILFTYLHLAAEPELTRALIKKDVEAVAYETIQLSDGSLPLLTPMSEVAGRMAIQEGAHFLEKPFGGSGILLGGVPGVPPAEVVIIGGGVVGTNAAKMAVGLGARVTILDNDSKRLRELDDLFGSRIVTLYSNSFNIAGVVRIADLLVGAVLIPGAKAPKLVSEEMVKTMKSGAVIVDVAVDQGGCIETVDKSTTHSQPTYTKYGVIHYAVANIPGAVARTSTFALTNVTLPYALKIANLGLGEAMEEDPSLALGLNVSKGKIVYDALRIA